MANFVPTVYSFKDTNGAFVHPLITPVLLTGGNIGVGRFLIAMARDRSEHDVVADGAVMVSYISGRNGNFAVECQQTSVIHKQLLNWYNLIETLAEGGDASLWASGALELHNLVDGSSHQLNGISPTKIPDKPYEERGSKIVWTLLAAQILQTSS